VYCSISQCLAVCCSVLQCVVVCCSVLQCVAACCSMSQSLALTNPRAQRAVAVRRFALQCAAVYCSVLQCVAACSSVLQSSAQTNPPTHRCAFQGTSVCTYMCVPYAYTNSSSTLSEISAHSTSCASECSNIKMHLSIHKGDQTSNIWISRCTSFPDRSFE